MEKIWWMFLKSFGWPFWFPLWVQKIVPGSAEAAATPAAVPMPGSYKQKPEPNGSG